MQRLDPSLGTSAASAEIPPVGLRQSATRMALAILARQPSLVFLVVLQASLTACLALLALDAVQGYRVALGKMIGATRIVVLVDPHTSRQDAESLGAQLSMMQGVGEARLRKKEEALTAIEAAGLGIASVSEEISLPDAWLLTMQTPATSGEMAPRSMMATAELWQETAASIPGVEAVRVDRSWIAELDRRTNLFRDMATAVRGGIICISIILLFSLFLLATLAFRAHPLPDESQYYGSSIGVFAYLGFSLAMLSVAGAYLFHAFAAFALREFVSSEPGQMQPWLTAFSNPRTDDMLTVVAAIFVSVVTAVLLAARRDRLMDRNR